MGRKITLWHISPMMNVESILWSGIDPRHSTGKFERCWYVRWHGLVWALAHISMKKHIPIWQLVCFRVKVDEECVTHFNRNVFTSKCVIKTSFYLSAERALSQWEKQRKGKPRKPHLVKGL